MMAAIHYLVILALAADLGFIAYVALEFWRDRGHD